MTRLAVLAATFVACLGASPPLHGTFALQDASPKTRGYLVASPRASDPSTVRLDLWLTTLANSKPIVAFDMDMTKLLHTIVVSDDFGTFAHIHPVFSSDGHFRIVHHFPKPGLYHVYEDATPHELGQQVFRFDVPIAPAPPALATRALAPTGPVAHAGPYVVSLDRTTLSTSGETMLIVRVRERGAPARDLHPYLGALAHAVFLNARDLTYVHVHPLPLGASMPAMPRMDGMSGMEMPALSPNARTSPDMQLHVAVHEAGLYKLWLQFRGGSELHAATFVLRAT